MADLTISPPLCPACGEHPKWAQGTPDLLHEEIIMAWRCPNRHQWQTMIPYHVANEETEILRVLIRTMAGLERHALLDAIETETGVTRSEAAATLEKWLGECS